MKINLYYIMLCAALLGLISADITNSSDSGTSTVALTTTPLPLTPPTPVPAASASTNPDDEQSLAQRYGWLKPYLGVGATAAIGGRVSRGIQTGELAQSLGNLSPYLSEAGSQIGYGIGALGRGTSALASGIGSGLGYGAGALGATARHAWEAAAPTAWIQKAIPQIIQQAPTKLSAWEAAKLAAHQGLGAGYKAYTQGIQHAPTYLMPNTGAWDTALGGALGTAALAALAYYNRDKLANVGQYFSGFVPERAAIMFDNAASFIKKIEELEHYQAKMKQEYKDLSDTINRLSKTDYESLDETNKAIYNSAIETRKDVNSRLMVNANNITKHKQYTFDAIPAEIQALEATNELLEKQIRILEDAQPNIKDTDALKENKDQVTELVKKKLANSEEIKNLTVMQQKLATDLNITLSPTSPQ